MPMVIQKQNAKINEQIFRYQLMPVFFATSIFINGSLTFLAVSIGVSYGYSNGFLFFLIFVLFFSGVSFFIVCSYSDIVINEKQISRRIGVVTWKNILWSNVEKIRFIETIVRGGGVKAAIIIVPKRTAYGQKLRSMILYKEVNDTGKFIKTIDDYANKYSIPVEK